MPTSGTVVLLARTCLRSFLCLEYASRAMLPVVGLHKTEGRVVHSSLNGLMGPNTKIWMTGMTHRGVEICTSPRRRSEAFLTGRVFKRSRLAKED